MTPKQRAANAIAFRNAAEIIKQRDHDFLLHGSDADTPTRIEAKQFVIDTLEGWAWFEEKVR